MRRVTGLLFFVISAAWGADADPNRIQDEASAAREHGIPANVDAARAHAAQTFAFLAGLGKAVQYTEIIDPALSEGYLLLAADAAGVAPNLTTAVYARHIALRQQRDGHWLTTGRPAAAVIQYRNSHHGRHARDSALQPSQHGGRHQSPHPLARRLAARQQPDGGWHALDGRPSDAYSTGQVLTALHGAGDVPISDPAWRRGIQYLLDTQAKDGSWHVATRMRP